MGCSVCRAAPRQPCAAQQAALTSSQRAPPPTPPTHPASGTQAPSAPGPTPAKWWTPAPSTSPPRATSRRRWPPGGAFTAAACRARLAPPAKRTPSGWRRPGPALTATPWWTSSAVRSWALRCAQLCSGYFAEGLSAAQAGLHQLLSALAGVHAPTPAFPPAPCRRCILGGSIQTPSAHSTRPPTARTQW